MTHRKILVVDDNSQSLETIAKTLNDAQVPFIAVSNNADAITAFQADSELTLVLARAFGGNVLGLDLCREIRQFRTPAELSVIVILSEDEQVKGADALLMGANDLLIDPFEPRELRMRANIVMPEQRTRVDRAHTASNDSRFAGLTEPEFFVPEFDARSKQLTFGKNKSRISGWEADPDVTKVALDKVIVCPKCDAIPTFRPGCGCCGSAWIESESLMHHDACAHIGPEREFLKADGLVCPQCRRHDLVAGSEFEQITGGLRCSDCDAIVSEAKMIGHCLSCEHRFPAAEGKLQSIHGYRVGRSRNVATIAAPRYRVIQSSQPAEII